MQRLFNPSPQIWSEFSGTARTLQSGISVSATLGLSVWTPNQNCMFTKHIRQLHSLYSLLWSSV